jgi:guanylate kinase
MTEVLDNIKMEKAIIITAPSGAGKSTIAEYVLSVVENLDYSVSATTRTIRKGEEEGKDYYFISKEQFLKKIEEDAFVEWEEVYEGTFYGTLKSEVQRIWSLGKAVLYVVDVIGAKDLKHFFGDKALSIFIQPPSIKALEERLRKRQSESEKSLEIRLERVRMELKEKKSFDLVIVNDELELAQKQTEKEVRKFLLS